MDNSTNNKKPMSDMTPVDGGAAVLIPNGNMNKDVVGSYGWMQQKYWSNKERKHKTSDWGGWSSEV